MEERGRQYRDGGFADKRRFGIGDRLVIRGQFSLSDIGRDD